MKVIYLLYLNTSAIYRAFVGLILGIGIGYLSTKRLGTAFAMISLGFCELVTALTLIFVFF